MALNLINLDAPTRRFMLDEIKIDELAGKLYISSRLSNKGAADYPALLKTAATAADDSFLANELRATGRLNSSEPRNTKNGVTWAKVPVTAPETMAEGEFNRFYARGLCRRAIEEEINKVRVYRAKVVMNPRSESEALLGQIFEAEALLQDLRANIGTDTALGIPPGPNSGLSICLP